MRVIIQHGDITRIATDAIVNAANVEMLGGGGVDGAIHRAAGPRLKEACAAYPEVSPGIRCPVGGARITDGFDLPAKYVIHTVGPMWHNSPGCRAIHYPGESKQVGKPRDLLASSIASCLTLARNNGVETIAFPAISCGVFGGSIVTFAKVAYEVLSRPEYSVHSPKWTNLKEIVFVLFQLEEYEQFQRTWSILT